MENKAIITLRGVTYDYVTPAETVHALRGVTCDFELGVTYAVTGRSGSGKSTLLSLLAGFDLPLSGEILIEERNIRELDREEYRRGGVGIIFQSYYLIPHLTVYENIRLALEITKHPCRDYNEYIKSLLERVGLPENYMKKLVTRLSGGEQQRVAIARAIATDPKIILADEPTGNLDNDNAMKIFDILKSLSRDGKCVIIVTHSEEIAERTDMRMRMSDGIITEKQSL